MSRPASSSNQPRRFGPSLFGSIIAVLVLALLASGGVALQQYLISDVTSGNAAHKAVGALRQEWDSGAKQTVTTGRPFALVRIPRFGAGWEWPVTAGVSGSDISHSIGWYPRSASPGQVGNCALAGYRVTHGSPFARIDDLRPGDEMVIETATSTYTYVLDTAPVATTVRDDASWALAAVPGHPGELPSTAVLTLTTNQDLIRSHDRTVAFGHLTSAVAK